MSILSRINSLIRADAHGVVDALEDKALLLKQALREAELALNQHRARAETLVAENKRLGEGAARLASQMEAIDADVQLALSEGKDDLARFAIRKLLPLRRERDGMLARLAVVDEEQVEIAAQLVEHEQDFEALKVRVRNHLARLELDPDGDDPQGGVAGFAGAAVEDEEIELELLRRRQGVNGGQRDATDGGA